MDDYFRHYGSRDEQLAVEARSMVGVHRIYLRLLNSSRFSTVDVMRSKMVRLTMGHRAGCCIWFEKRGGCTACNWLPSRFWRDRQQKRTDGCHRTARACSQQFRGQKSRLSDCWWDVARRRRHVCGGFVVDCSVDCTPIASGL